MALWSSVSGIGSLLSAEEVLSPVLVLVFGSLLSPIDEVSLDIESLLFLLSEEISAETEQETGR